jgi:hypothetical protein
VTSTTTLGHTTWAAWIADPANAAADDFIKLAALRKYIHTAAANGHEDEPSRLTSEWVNKKLAKLGVPDRIDGENTYTLEVPVTGINRRTVVASNRAEAERLFASMHGTQIGVTDYTLQDTPTFTSGPEDPDPAVVDPAAPTTVDATLTAFREYLLLAVIAGPRLCEHGVNEVLEKFGLDRVPQRKEFTVTRPATATVTTTITAYDEASARRVAEWRWASDHSGYTATFTSEAGDFTVAAR